MTINQNTLYVLFLSVFASANDVDLANNTNFLILLLLVLNSNTVNSVTNTGFIGTPNACGGF